jgi:hypothetical protein
MTAEIVAAAGWAGAVALVIGYAQTSRGRWAADGPAFQGLSIFGSGSLALAAGTAGVWSSAVLNITWLAIGVAVLARRSRRRPAPERRPAGQDRVTA